MKKIINQQNFDANKGLLGDLAKSHVEFFDHEIEFINQKNQWILTVQDEFDGHVGGAVLSIVDKTDIDPEAQEFFSKFPWFHKESHFLTVTRIIPPSDQADCCKEWDYMAAKFHRELYDLFVNFSLIEGYERILILSKDWDLHEASAMGLWPCTSSFEGKKNPEQWVFGFMDLTPKTYGDFAYRWYEYTERKMCA